MIPKIRPTLGRSLFLLWSSHLLLDFFTGIWPIYKTIAGIDLAKAGLIAGLAGCFGEFLQLFFGYFSDRGFRKRITMFGLALSSSVLLITFTDNMVSAFFVLLFLMIGSGSFHPAAVGYAGLLSPQQKGRNILLFASGGALGLAISQLTFTHTLRLFGGNATILFLPVVVLLLFMAFYPVEEQMNNKRLSLREFFQPLVRSRRPLLLLYLTQVCNFTMLTAFMFLLPDLMRTKGCSEWLCMGGGHLCFVLGGAMLMVPSGYLSDRFGSKPVLLTILFFSLLLFYTYLVQPELSLSSKRPLFSRHRRRDGHRHAHSRLLGKQTCTRKPQHRLCADDGLCVVSGEPRIDVAGLIARHAATDQPILMTLFIMGSLLAVGFFLILFMPQKAYHARTETWNLGRAKAPGLDDRKRVHIDNIEPFAIVQPRELSRGPNSKFQTARGIPAEQAAPEQEINN